MKEALAVVALVLSLLIAYRVHQNRTQVVATAGQVDETQNVVRTSLVSVLSQYRGKLSERLDETRPTDVGKPLRTLRDRVIDRQRNGEPVRADIHRAGLALLNTMVAAADERTRTLEEILKIRNRLPSALDREDSSSTASSFFIDNLRRKFDANNEGRQTLINQAFSNLQAVEAETVRKHGETAALDDYQTYRMLSRALTVTANEKENPLDRGTYNFRRVMPRREEESGLQNSDRTR